MGRGSGAGGGAPKTLEAGIAKYIDDQRYPPRFPRKPAPPPLEYALIELAKQYGQDPLTWPYDHDATAVRRMLNILSVAGKAHGEADRAGPDSIRLGD